MSELTLDSVFVLLTDWRGHVVWTTSQELTVRIGEFSWSHLDPASQQRAKEAHGKVAALREPQSLLVQGSRDRHFRCWMWPLDSPDVAVCVLARQVPAALAELSERELECLELLAHGVETREIAQQLDLSLSTVHTHLKRAREKLGLTTIEALISFAARFCYSKSAPLSKATEE